MKKFFENKPRAWFLIGAIFILLITTTAIASIVYLNYKENDNALYRVGSEKITKQDFSFQYHDINSASNPYDISVYDTVSNETREMIEEKLIERSVLRQAAEKKGLGLSEEELEKLYNNSDPNNILEEPDKYILLGRLEEEALEKKIKENLLAVKKGRYIEIRFDRNFVVDPSLSGKEKEEKEKNQEENIKKDREYADNLKTKIYNDLKSGKITFDEAMKIVEEDSYIDYKNWGATVASPARTFDTENSPTGWGITEDENFNKALEKTKANEISEPFIKKLDYGDWEKDEVDFVDAMWVILTVDESKEGEIKDYDKWLSDMQNEIGVRKIEDFWDKIGYKENVVLAADSDFYNTNCSKGRDDQGIDHPGDLISDAWIDSKSGTNYQLDGSYNGASAYSYVKPGSNAYAYSGCPIPGTGYTVNGESGYWRSEITNYAGCMYKFSSVAPLADRINLCCSGNHNSHIWVLGYSGTMDPYGHWNHYHVGSSDGSAWSGQYFNAFDDYGYGGRYSGKTTFDIINGETIYRRGWWNDDSKLTMSVSPSNSAGNITGYGINCGNGGTDCTNYFQPYNTDDVPYHSYTATAAPGYRFVGWDSDGDGSIDYTVNPLNITHTRDWPSFKAVFEVNSTSCSVTSNTPATNQTINVGETLSFSMTANNANSTSIRTSSGTNVSPKYTFNTAGTYNINFDCDGNDSDTTYDDRRTITVTVEDIPIIPPPSPSSPTLNCKPSPQNGLAPLVVQFDVTSTGTLNSNSVTFYSGENNDSGNPIAIIYSLITGRRTIYYTYNNARPEGYNAYIQSPDTRVGTNGRVGCGVSPIGVGNPNDGGGGEVAP